MLTHTKGEYACTPFMLYPWQRQIVVDVFGSIKSNGCRQYSTAYVEIPKKNGKTELAAGIALYGLIADAEPGSENYFAAATRDQASIGFKVAAQMVRNNPRLNGLCRIIDSTKTIVMRDDPSSFLKAISADAGTNDGINPHVAVFDELHRQRDTDLWDVITYGMSARRQPLLFAITTAGISGESPLAEAQREYALGVQKGIFPDPSYYSAIYGLGEKEDWTNEGQPDRKGRPATGWYKANPSLGHHLKIEKVREEFLQAQGSLANQNSFRRFRLDQWVGQESRFLPMDDWMACGEPFRQADFIGAQCFAGIDLSATQDITALVLVFEKAGLYHIVPHFWLPEYELHLRARRDKVPYDIWASQGLLHTTPGNQVDYAFLKKTVRDLSRLYDIREIAYDRWNATPVIQDLQAEGMTMVPIGQGYQSMSAPTKELLRLVNTGKLRHGSNQILTWMANCFSVKQDPADNVKPSKPDRRKTGKRIDGIQALVNALARVIVRPEYKRSIYETEGIKIL